MPSNRLQVIEWFDRVRNDIQLMDDAIEYYKGVIHDGQLHLPVVGNLGRLQAEIPGLLHFYDQRHNDAEAIRTYIEYEYETMRSERFIEVVSFDGKKQYGEMKVTEVKHFVDADEAVRILKVLLLRITHATKQLKTLYNELKGLSFKLNNLQSLREHDLHEVVIDMTRENIYGS